MERIKFEDLEKKFRYGDYTAFVYCDAARNEREYVGETINETNTIPFLNNAFVVGMNEVPQIKKIMETCFLEEFEPASGISDDGYDEFVRRFNEKDGQIAVGYDGYGDVVFMLLW